MTPLLPRPRRRDAVETVDPSSGAPDVSRDLGVYVHVPFCTVRCPYCDFAVDTRPDIPHDRYARAIAAELSVRAPWFAPPGTGGAPLADRFRSIYFGGGTPALWDPAAVGGTIAAVIEAFALPGTGHLEITVEANPGDLTGERLDALRSAGVNRLSLGVQALDDDLLQRLGRNHRAADAVAAVAGARAAGFERLSCDLMFALPGQTLEGWQRDLDRLLALGPDHVSAYGLTIEAGTAFGSDVRAGRMAAPQDDASAAMFEHAHATLAAAGFEHYEVSSHARPGQRSVHNGLYWSGAAYLGLGASASSFRPLHGGGAWRFTNPRGTESYLRAVEAGAGRFSPASAESRTAADSEREALWLALRTSDGVDRQAHAARHGRDPLAEPDRLRQAERCVRAGWLTVDDRRIALTTAGWLFADEVAERLWS